MCQQAENLESELARSSSNLLKLVDDRHKETGDSIRQLSRRIDDLSNKLRQSVILGSTQSPSM